MKGLVIAGSASGVGKTVATLVLLQALTDEGYAVQPAKAGPDFIDPSHHRNVTGTPSRTLDVWMQGVDGVRENYARGAGEFCLVEGVMGLYDGGETSTAAVASVLDLPVILVVDGSARMESVAAEAHGYREYAQHAGVDIDVVGIIVQQVHGGRHAVGIREALPDGIQYFGRIPPMDELEIPERHLGLHLGDEHPIPQSALRAAGEELSLEQIIAAAKAPHFTLETLGEQPTATSKIAVARDEAFQFIYPGVIEQLRERATVIEFSPIHDTDVPTCDGLYLPGGYPERFASELARSDAVGKIASLASDGLPIYGECGGMMLLAETITTQDGSTYPMAGVLPATVQMHERFQALGHVELAANTETITAKQSDHLRGHEFHYSSATVADDAEFAFSMCKGTGITGDADGLVEYATLGTYSHMHAASTAFETFISKLSS